MAAALVFPGALAAQPQGGGPPPASVMTDPVRLETIERWREVTGELRCPVRSVLASENDGLVVEMTVEPGDAVEAGQTIARLDDRMAGLEVKRAEANLVTRRAVIAEREAQLSEAKADLARIEDSFARQSASQAERDDARTTQAAALARLEQARSELLWAEADLDRVREHLSDMVVKAPFAGSIASKRTEVGQWLQEGDEVAELLALDTVDAWLDVPESIIDRLLRPSESGEPTVVQVRVASLGKGGQTFTAPIAGIVPSADALSRLFPVRVRLENKDRRLRPGMSVIGLVPAGTTEPALTISKDAVLRGDTGPYVYVAAGGVAQIAPVTVLHAVGPRVVVRSDALREGAPVIVEGNERLYPGRPVVPANTPPPSPTSSAPAAGGAPAPDGPDAAAPAEPSPSR